MRTRRYLVKLTAEPVQVREEASVELPKSAPEMWAWLWDASSNVDLFDAALAMSLPGTPRGVGEVQVVIPRPGHDRIASVHEIVHLEPVRRAVTRNLISGYPSGGELLIDPIGPEACRVTQAFTAELPPGTQVVWIDELRGTLRTALSTMVRRLVELHG
jgi:hypothetical protein